MGNMLFICSVWAWCVRLATFGVERAVFGGPIYSIYCRTCVARISEFGAHVHWPRDCFVEKPDTVLQAAAYVNW